MKMACIILLESEEETELDIDMHKSPLPLYCHSLKVHFLLLFSILLQLY